MNSFVFVVVITFFMSSYFLIHKRSDKAVIMVIIPSLFLLPSTFYYGTNLPVWKINFATCSLLPLIGWFLLVKLYEMKIRTLDLLILIYFSTELIIGFIKKDFGYSMRTFLSNIVIFFFLYIILKLFFKNSFFTKRLLYAVMISATILLVFAPYEFLTGNYIIKHFWTSDYPFFQQAGRWGFNRIQLFFSHPISAGITYSCVAITAFWMKMKFKNSKKRLWIFFGLGVMGTVMSISRGPVLFLGFIIVLIFMKNIKTKYKVAGISVMLIFVIVFNLQNEAVEVDNSTKYRLNLIENAHELLNDSILIGYGGNIKYRGKVGYAADNKDVMTIDNFYLYRAFTGGIVMLALFLAMIVCFYYYYFKIKKNKLIKSNDKLWADLAAIIVLNILLNYIFVANMLHTDILLFIMFALVASIYQKGYIKEQSVEIEYNFKRIL